MAPPAALIGIGMAAGTAILLSACSASFSVGGDNPSEAAVSLIEGELADQLGEELSASCPSVDDDTETGATFVCTAVSSTGETMIFDAELVSDETVNVGLRTDQASAPPPTEQESTDSTAVTPDDAPDASDNTTPDADGPNASGNTTLSEHAVVLIQTTLADELGLTLTATCEDVPLGAAVNTTFLCTATTNEGQVADFLGVVDAENHVAVESTNVVSRGAIPTFVEAIAEVASEQLGKTVEADCGSESIILDESLSIKCALIDDAGEEIPIVVSEIDPTAGTFRFAEK